MRDIIFAHSCAKWGNSRVILEPTHLRASLPPQLAHLFDADVRPADVLLEGGLLDPRPTALDITITTTDTLEAALYN